MKPFTLSFLAVVTAVGLSTLGGRALAAEGAPTKTPAKAGQGQRGDRMEAMAKELGLTEDQKTKLAAIQKEETAKLRALTPEERKAQSKELREGMAKKVKPILTPEQFEKWQKMRAERMKRGGGQQSAPKKQPKTETN